VTALRVFLAVDVGTSNTVAVLRSPDGRVRPLLFTVLHRRLRIAPIVLDQPELAVAEGAVQAVPSPTAGPHPEDEDPVPASPVRTQVPGRFRPRPVVAIAVAFAVAVVAVAVLIPRLDRPDHGSGVALPAARPSAGITQAPGGTPSAGQSTSPPPAPTNGATPTALAVTPELRAFVSPWDKYSWGPDGCTRFDYSHSPDGAYGKLGAAIGREPDEWIYCHQGAYEAMFAIFRSPDRRDLVWEAYTTAWTSSSLVYWSDRLAPNTSKTALVWRDPVTATLGILVSTESEAKLHGTWERYNS